MRSKLSLVECVLSALCAALSLFCAVAWLPFLMPMLISAVPLILKAGILFGLLGIVGSGACALLRRREWPVLLAFAACGTLVSGLVITVGLAVVAWE